MSIIVVITSSRGHARLRPKITPHENTQPAEIMKEVSPTSTTQGTIDQLSGFPTNLPFATLDCDNYKRSFQSPLVRHRNVWDSERHGSAARQVEAYKSIRGYWSIFNEHTTLSLLTFMSFQTLKWRQATTPRSISSLIPQNVVKRQ